MFLAGVRAHWELNCVLLLWIFGAILWVWVVLQGLCLLCYFACLDFYLPDLYPCYVYFFYLSCPCWCCALVACSLLCLAACCDTVIIFLNSDDRSLSCPFFPFCIKASYHSSPLLHFRSLLLNAVRFWIRMSPFSLSLPANLDLVCFSSGLWMVLCSRLLLPVCWEHSCLCHWYFCALFVPLSLVYSFRSAKWRLWCSSLCSSCIVEQVS